MILQTPLVRHTVYHFIELTFPFVCPSVCDKKLLDYNNQGINIRFTSHFQANVDLGQCGLIMYVTLVYIPKRCTLIQVLPPANAYTKSAHAYIHLVGAWRFLDRVRSSAHALWSYNLYTECRLRVLGSERNTDNWWKLIKPCLQHWPS